MDFPSILAKIEFVKRYESICATHNNFEERMRGSNNKLYLKILKKFEDAVVYLSPDRIFRKYTT